MTVNNCGIFPPSAAAANLYNTVTLLDLAYLSLNVYHDNNPEDLKHVGWAELAKPNKRHCYSMSDIFIVRQCIADYPSRHPGI